ncbi:hypothetical protein P4C99_21725 [Pontiellaceae bacterium B1224]|nr:hypothetical protein [Pontiellaceae bacterium B1224]
MKIKPKTIIRIIALSALICGLGYYELMRGFITHPSYMKWVLFGGEYKPEFLRCFIDDEFSQGIIRGKTVKELRQWFPEMRSTRWLDDEMEKMRNPDYQPERETDLYMTGAYEFAGLFIEIEEGKAIRAKLLKDIPNQLIDPTWTTPDFEGNVYLPSGS